MNYKHIVPRNEASKHDTRWPDNGKSSCRCGAVTDEATRTIRHKPIK